MAEEMAGLIKDTEFETLIRGYKQTAIECREREESFLETDSNSQRNNERKNIIAREVQSVYCFLYEFGKPYSNMTVGEFEIGQLEMLKQVEQAIVEKEKELAQTLFFRVSRKKEIRKELSRLRFKKEKKYGYNIRSNSFYELCELVGIVECKIDWKTQPPPNFEYLVREIFKKRFPHVK